jgi:hypothetical protein
VEVVRAEDEDTNNTPSTPYCLQESLDSLLSELAAPISLAIGRTIPGWVGKRHDKIFKFVRELQALPGLKTVPVPQLKALFRQWYDRARPIMQTDPPIAFEAAWWDFVEGWPKVKVPKNEEVIMVAFERALCGDLPQVAKEYENPKTKILVGLCRELQRASGDRPFFLASRTAAGLLEVSHPTIAFWLRGLQTDGILKLVERGTAKTGQASRFRYIAAE